MTVLETEKLSKNHLNSDNLEPFDDIKYICVSADLITKSLQKGFDVAQLPNGDIIITEVKTVNIHYSWDHQKQKMVRINQIQ